MSLSKRAGQHHPAIKLGRTLFEASPKIELLIIIIAIVVSAWLRLFICNIKVQVASSIQFSSAHEAPTHPAAHGDAAAADDDDDDDGERNNKIITVMELGLGGWRGAKFERSPPEPNN